MNKLFVLKRILFYFTYLYYYRHRILTQHFFKNNLDFIRITRLFIHYLLFSRLTELYFHANDYQLYKTFIFKQKPSARYRLPSFLCVQIIVDPVMNVPSIKYKIAIIHTHIHIHTYIFQKILLLAHKGM